MRKFLLTLAVLCGAVSGWAQTSLRISEGLLANQLASTQYEWTSGTLYKPAEGDFNKLRITFLSIILIVCLLVSLSCVLQNFTFMTRRVIE